MLDDAYKVDEKSEVRDGIVVARYNSVGTCLSALSVAQGILMIDKNGNIFKINNRKYTTDFTSAEEEYEDAMALFYDIFNYTYAIGWRTAHEKNKYSSRWVDMDEFIVYVTKYIKHHMKKILPPLDRTFHDTADIIRRYLPLGITDITVQMVTDAIERLESRNRGHRLLRLLEYLYKMKGALDAV